MISYITRYTDLSNKPFIIRPKPQEDELLSSWLVRVALAHNTLPVSFMNMHFPKYKNIIFSRDLDIWAPDDLLEAIQEKSQYGVDEIKAMTLKSYSGILAPKIEPNGRNLFISPIKVRGRRNQSYGQRYCPLCLQEDHILYFRKKWRLSFVTVCPKHNCYLLDRCSQCFAPISIYKFHKQRGYDVCYQCAFHLNEAKIVMVSDNNMSSTQLYDILVSHRLRREDHKISSIIFFEKLAEFIRENEYQVYMNPDERYVMDLSRLYESIFYKLLVLI